MKIKYLGTAAAEGWPAVFCNCDACKQAKELGGKNIRTRSQVLINDDLLVDFPMDTYLHMLQYKLDLSKVSDMLVTHSHSDHFYPQELQMRGGCYSLNMKSENLNIYGNQKIIDYFMLVNNNCIENDIMRGLTFHSLQIYHSFTFKDYTITPLPAVHMHDEVALLYLIEQLGKSVLYLNDTGRLKDEVYDFLEKNNKSVDLVSFDCTHGYTEVGFGRHMGVMDNAYVRNKLIEKNITHKNTKYVITHFSHNSKLNYEALTEKVKDMNFTVSYDGMEIEI